MRLIQLSPFKSSYFLPFAASASAHYIVPHGACMLRILSLNPKIHTRPVSNIFLVSTTLQSKFPYLCLGFSAIVALDSVVFAELFCAAVPSSVKDSVSTSSSVSTDMVRKI